MTMRPCELQIINVLAVDLGQRRKPRSALIEPVITPVLAVRGESREEKNDGWCQTPFFRHRHCLPLGVERHSVHEPMALAERQLNTGDRCTECTRDGLSFKMRVSGFLDRDPVVQCPNHDPCPSGPGKSSDPCNHVPNLLIGEKVAPGRHDQRSTYGVAAFADGKIQEQIR